MWTKIVVVFLVLGTLSFKTVAQIKESYKAKIAYKIVETSARCRQLTKGLYERVIKNGGTSYGLMLESSPNPKTDPSQGYAKTYNFNLHEVMLIECRLLPGLCSIQSRNNCLKKTLQMIN